MTHIDASVSSSLIALLGVVVGAFVTGAMGARRELEKELRGRSLEVLSESIGQLGLVRVLLRDFAYYAPRGGGRIRESGNPSAEWQELDPKEAEEADNLAAQAFDRLNSALQELRVKSMELGVLTNSSLRMSFEGIANAIEASFREDILVESDADGNEQAFHSGAAMSRLQKKVDDLIEQALGTARDAVRDRSIVR